MAKSVWMARCRWPASSKAPASPANVVSPGAILIAATKELVTQIGPARGWGQTWAEIRPNAVKALIPNDQEPTPAKPTASSCTRTLTSSGGSPVGANLLPNAHVERLENFHHCRLVRYIRGACCSPYQTGELICGSARLSVTQQMYD